MAAPTFSSTKETTNYARLCRLMVDVGTQALRDTLDAIHPPANLPTVLAGNKTTLQTLRIKKVINAAQWGKLFPAISTLVSSVHFDISLLMVLLRNLCSLPSPATGWDKLPAVTDVSREADIARVKYYRNTVYGHAECASVDDAAFNAYWSDIRDALVRLGGVKYKTAIDKLETEVMDPDLDDRYKELLRQWKKDEDNVKDQLDELTKKVDDLESTVKGIYSIKDYQVILNSPSFKVTVVINKNTLHYYGKHKQGRKGERGSGCSRAPPPPHTTSTSTFELLTNPLRGFLAKNKNSFLSFFFFVDEN